MSSYSFPFTNIIEHIEVTVKDIVGRVTFISDKRKKTKVVAVEDIYPYTSCSKCWKKTHEDDLICNCGNADNIYVNDFYAKFYIEKI